MAHLGPIVHGLAGGVFAWLFVLVAPAAAEPLSVGEAAARALRENPSVRIGVASARQAEAHSDAALARLLPRLDAGAALTRTDNPVMAFGTRLNQGALAASDLSPDALADPAAVTDSSARLDLSVPIVDVAAWYALHATVDGQDAARAQLRLERANVVVATVRTYFLVQVAEARAAIALQLVTATEQDLARARAMLETGMVHTTAVSQLEAELAELQEGAIIARSQTELARAELARLLGQAPDEQFPLTTPLSAEPPLIDGGDRPPPHHPSLAAADAAVAAAEAEQRAAAWAFAPTLQAHGSLEHHAPRPFASGGENYLVGATLSWNLFAGLGDLARQRLADAKADRERAHRDLAQGQLRVALQRARRAVLEAGARLRVTEEGLEHAREFHRLVRARHESGMAVTTEVLRARSALLSAEERHLHAQSARHGAAVELAAALGVLDAGWPPRTRSERQ